MTYEEWLKENNIYSSLNKEDPMSILEKMNSALEDVKKYIETTTVYPIESVILVSKNHYMKETIANFIGSLSKSFIDGKVFKQAHENMPLYTEEEEKDPNLIYLKIFEYAKKYDFDEFKLYIDGLKIASKSLGFKMKYFIQNPNAQERAIIGSLSNEILGMIEAIAEIKSYNTDNFYQKIKELNLF